MEPVSENTNCKYGEGVGLGIQRPELFKKNIRVRVRIGSALELRLGVYGVRI